MMRPLPTRQAGFTLLEVLVAMAIFALLGLGAQRTVLAVLEANQAAAAQSEQLAALQRTVTLISRDVAQMAPRARRDAYGAPHPPLETGGEFLLSFTRRGWQSLLPMRRSELHPVAYRLENGVLRRYYWNVTDAASDTLPQAQELMRGVKRVRFRYLNDQHQWLERWQDAPLPQAVEMTLETERFAEIRRIWEVKGE